jgi:hypothetical protein
VSQPVVLGSFDIGLEGGGTAHRPKQHKKCLIFRVGSRVQLHECVLTNYCSERSQPAGPCL